MRESRREEGKKDGKRSPLAEEKWVNSEYFFSGLLALLTSSYHWVYKPVEWLSTGRTFFVVIIASLMIPQRSTWAPSGMLREQLQSSWWWLEIKQNSELPDVNLVEWFRDVHRWSSCVRSWVTDHIQLHSFKYHGGSWRSLWCGKVSLVLSLYWEIFSLRDCADLSGLWALTTFHSLFFSLREWIVSQWTRLLEIFLTADCQPNCCRQRRREQYCHLFFRSLVFSNRILLSLKQNSGERYHSELNIPSLYMPMTGNPSADYYQQRISRQGKTKNLISSYPCRPLYAFLLNAVKRSMAK